MSNMMNGLMSDAADEKLVEWAKKGDLEAYAELVEKEQEFEDVLEQNLSEVQRAKYLVFSVEFYRTLGEKLNRVRAVSREKRKY